MSDQVFPMESRVDDDDQYYALEVATDAGYLVYVDLNPETLDFVARYLLGAVEVFNSYLTGSVTAETKLEAIDKVRRGEWYGDPKKREGGVGA